MSPPFLRIAIPAPVFRLFDYRAPISCNQAMVPGMRVYVPFAGRRCIGILVALAEQTDIPAAKLKEVSSLLDDEPLITPDILELAMWAADYYHHPIGEVLASALPPDLRLKKSAKGRALPAWAITPAGAQALATQALKRAPAQQRLLRFFQNQNEGPITKDILAAAFTRVDHAALRALVARGWIESVELAQQAASSTPTSCDCPPTLTEAQEQAVSTLSTASGKFYPCLLDGVTGSGKTEVYLRVIADVLAQGRQALVLVPEIGLTPQLVQRFEQRFPVPIVVLHSDLSDSNRARAWLDARYGRARIVIGTRSAVFVPLPQLGVIVVDEEHDNSLKQHEGFHYHARDVAVKRAKLAQVPIILGSATPALDTIFNARSGRYHSLRLPARVGASQPSIELINVRGEKLLDGISTPVLHLITEHLRDDSQILVFINRRGYAPILLCHECGWIAQCRRCDARLTLHQQDQRLRCHHCGDESVLPRSCPTCASNSLLPLGQGTERIDEALRRHFADAEVLRIDRDTIRGRGHLEALFHRLQGGRRQILVGTQLLAKGHHFPNITLVVIINADQGLFSTDFRASERLAQTIVQVAGRAGRAQRAGHVIIQTHHPEHPLLQRLLRDGYAGFAETALEERRSAHLPPFTALAILRADAPQEEQAMQFLDGARRKFVSLHTVGSIQIMGPLPAPMKMRAGRHRAQLIIQAQEKSALQRELSNWVRELDALPSMRHVRWTLDVDPQDMF